MPTLKPMSSELKENSKNLYTGPAWSGNMRQAQPEIPELFRDCGFYSWVSKYASASISTSISGDIKALT